MDLCWCCGALLDPLSHGVPCTEFACVKCGAALAEAPSVCLSETVTDQRALYRELHRLAFIASHTFVGIPGQDYINMLSSGDLRGTNPSNAADRHNAVMLEALRLRQAPERHRDRPRSRKGAGSTAADHSDLSGFRSSGHSLGRILLRLGTGRERDRGERRLLLHGQPTFSRQFQTGEQRARHGGPSSQGDSEPACVLPADRELRQKPSERCLVRRLRQQPQEARAGIQNCTEAEQGGR